MRNNDEGKEPRLDEEGLKCTTTVIKGFFLQEYFKIIIHPKPTFLNLLAIVLFIPYF